MELEAYGHNKISIHALREEGDRKGPAPACSCSYFYPRPPRGGRRVLSEKTTETEKFLSTPSARRATMDAALRLIKIWHFYPRPPRGGRRRMSTAF